MNAFEPSSRAAAASGRRRGGPPRAKRSTRPSVSGSSGPTTVRSIARSLREARRGRATSSAAIGTHSASRAMPAFPGAHEDRARRAGSAASFQTSACSRPPPPTTRTRIASVPEVPHAGEDHRDAVRVGGGDHLVVARAAARLDDRRRAARRSPPRGRRGTGRTRRTPSDRARERDAGARAARGAPHRLDARRLAAAERERAVRRGEDDRVRLDVLDDAPGESERRAARPSVGAASSRRGFARVLDGAVGDPARGARRRRRSVDRARPPRRRLGMPADEPSRLLLLEQLERVGLEGGRDQHLGEDLVDGARERAASTARSNRRCRRRATPDRSRTPAPTPRADRAPRPTPHGCCASGSRPPPGRGGTPPRAPAPRRCRRRCCRRAPSRAAARRDARQEVAVERAPPGAGSRRSACRAPSARRTWRLAPKRGARPRRPRRRPS